MKVQVQKWGNSLALRIPKSYAVETKIENGSTVEIAVQKGTIVVKPVIKENLTLVGESVDRFVRGKHLLFLWR